MVAKLGPDREDGLFLSGSCMSIPVICRGCHARFKVSDKFAGKSGACPKCKATINVPTKEEEVKVHAPAEFAAGGRGRGGRFAQMGQRGDGRGRGGRFAPMHWPGGRRVRSRQLGRAEHPRPAESDIWGDEGDWY